MSKRAARALLEAPPTLSRSLAPLYLNAVPSTLVEQYTQGCASFAEEYGLTHLLFFSRLLNVAHEAMAEHCLKEAGFEAALQLLAAELYQIALDWEKPELVSQARAVQARAAMVAGTVTATAGGGGGGGSGSGNAARLSAVQDDLDDLLARKKIVDVAVEIFEGRGTFDFPAAVGRLLSETLAGDVHLLRRAYPSGRTQEHNTFPKFWALLQVIPA